MICIFQCSQCLGFFPSAFRILLESDEDRLLVVFNRGLILMTEVNSLLLNYNKHLAFLSSHRFLPDNVFAVNCFNMVSFKIKLRNMLIKYWHTCKTLKS